MQQGHEAVNAQRTRPRAPRVSWRVWALGALLAVYALLTVAVIYRSPLLRLDSWFYDLHLQRQIAQGWKPVIRDYVIFGQRGPSTLVFLPFFFWVAWRTRSSRPLVMLVTALVLLNLSVGVVKVAIGRVGPFFQSDVHKIFAGGSIYPSGHVSNTVVLYGLIAMVAPWHKRWFAAAAVWLSLSVGAGTIYLKTHWFSDVVGGWVAGGLILLIMPWVMPTVQRWADWLVARLRAWRARRRGGPPSQLGGPQDGCPQDAGQKSTPVSPVASSHNDRATDSSFDAEEESTRRGAPRTSPTPSGP